MAKEVFIVAQKAIIRNKSKYLILKRSPYDPVYASHWDFPGGKLEQGENTYDALKREVKEETGLDVEVGKPEFVFSENPKNWVCFICYNCKARAGKIKLSNEHTEYRWAGREEILKLRTENYLRAFLRKQ